MTTIRADTVRGGLRYPFLSDAWAWELTATPFDQLPQAPPAPTLRWVKDDKVLDLVVPGMDCDHFFAETGLRPSLHKGGYVLSKRLSRLLRPYRFWGFFAPTEVRIAHNPEWDGALWDGCGRVSRAFLPRLLPALAGLSPATPRRFKHELLKSGRFEVTIMHETGQEKGDILVVDTLPGGADFMFPAGSAKRELTLEGRVFVGLTPRHAQDEMRLDIQSLINLYPFFTPEQLLSWVELESELFLERIKSGEIDTLLGRLGHIQSAEALERLLGWYVGEYLASGGQAMWFTSMVKAIAQQHLNRLQQSVGGKLRYPIPGGRYYIFPAAVGEREVPRGHIELDEACATAWVNSEDWLDHVVKLLGGCDGDDALWVFPFTDAADGERQVLVWRSPNQPGEYVVLRPTAQSHEIKWAVPGGAISYAPMDSRQLPPRIDTAKYCYGELEADTAHSNVEQLYDIAAMGASIKIAETNQGILGAYCNALMVTKALYGRLPERLPATLEAVIDGSVKTGADLTPVKAWTEMAARAIVKQGKPIPACLVDRLTSLLPKGARGQLKVSGGCHWLDRLAAGLTSHQEAYWAKVEVLAAGAIPPLAVFETAGDWLPLGRQLRQVYAQALRLKRSQEAAREASAQFLQAWPPQARQAILLAACTACYTLTNGDEFSDAVLWQLGPVGEAGQRLRGVAHEFLTALRSLGLIGEPVWTTEGAVVAYPCEAAPPTGIPVRLTGVWFNWLRATTADVPPTMGLVPKLVRDQAKARIAALAAGRFRGLPLTLERTEADRVVARTSRGNLFGWVPASQEVRLAQHQTWRIVYATAVDGNLHAILQAI
jgi:hypothetical protein